MTQPINNEELLGKIVLDRTYNIEGHLNIRLFFNEYGEIFYSFFDDGKDAEEALANGGKLAQTNIYRSENVVEIDTLTECISNLEQMSPKAMLEYVCGKEKYVLQRKTFDDNTTLIAITFAGYEEQEEKMSINRIIIDNGDKETGVRKKFIYERHNADDHNQQRIMWRNIDYTKPVPEYITEEYEGGSRLVPNWEYGDEIRNKKIDKIIGPEEYSPLYNCAIHIEKSYDGWYILDGDGKGFQRRFTRIEFDGSKFQANKYIGIIYPTYLSETIDETFPIGSKNIKIYVDRKEPYRYYDIPITCFRRFNPELLTMDGNNFKFQFEIDGATITRSGVLNDKGSIEDNFKTRVEMECDPVIDRRELELDIDMVCAIENRVEKIDKDNHSYPEERYDPFNFPYIKLFSCRKLGSKLIAKFKKTLDKPLSKVKKR